MKIEDLRLITKEGEGLTVEFKERYSSGIDRDIVAFSNTRGGCILLGVSDDGNIISHKLTNRLKAGINDIARKCDPPISIKKISQVGKVSIIEIEEGTEKPYSCREGYFRRLDATTQKMNRKEIELLFRQAFKMSFEEQIHPRVTWNEIDKSKIHGFFKEANINVKTIDPKKILPSLNLSDGKHIKNAGVLFFAKEPRRHILQCEMILAAFKGKSRVHIYDRKNIQGDLLTQFNEAIIFLEKHLNVRSEIQGVNRKDIYEIPIEALREAVANAIIHRDYSMRGTSIMVEVQEDSIVVKNPGGLPEGLTPKKLINTSIRRNELIADLFARMDKVERMGTGIQRMRDLMKGAGLSYPEITSDLFFTISFKRPPYSLKDTKTVKVTKKVTEKVTENQRIVLTEMKLNPHITTKELSDIVGISNRKIKENIRKLKEKQLINRIGSAKGGHWEIIGVKTPKNK